MTQRNEKELVEARRTFYEDAVIQDNLLQMGELAGKCVKLNQNLCMSLKCLLIPYHCRHLCTHATKRERAHLRLVFTLVCKAILTCV